MALYIGAALGAFVLIGAARLGLIAAWELRGYVETRHSTLGEQAAEILANGGEQALIDWLENDATIPADVSVYVLDADSRDILGRTLPSQYAEFIKNSVIGSPGDEDSNYRPVRLAPQLLGPDGKVFAFLLLPKGISLWGSPATALGLLVVALLVIASVAWIIARAFTRPINQLQLAVRELASGDIRARVPESIASRGDELGALAADFNSMAGHLTELIEGRESLMREMSHELRSPLARLHAAIALAAERDLLDEGERDRIEQEIGRMNRVIGEMLSYSSLDTAVAPINRLVRIGSLLTKLVAVEELEAANHECTLELTAAADLTVLGDPELLQRGFENILRNAIRYAPAGSAIEITAIRNNATKTPAGSGNIVVTISDCGPGVPTEHLQDIFEPYFRISSGNHHQDSTGLGLAIVKRVVERHKGSVKASQRQDGGLTITLTLPAVDLS
jgi:two-component system OmpR family sensor kinase